MKRIVNFSKSLNHQQNSTPTLECISKNKYKNDSCLRVEQNWNGSIAFLSCFSYFNWRKVSHLRIESWKLQRKGGIVYFTMIACCSCILFQIEIIRASFNCNEEKVTWIASSQTIVAQFEVKRKKFVKQKSLLFESMNQSERDIQEHEKKGMIYSVIKDFLWSASWIDIGRG